MNTIDESLKEQYVDYLNSKIFYKISFSISANVGYENLDLLWEFVLSIKRWLERKERKYDRVHPPKDIKIWSWFKNGNKIYDAKRLKTFYAESILRVNPEDGKDISWACRIRECENESGYAPRWWNTEIGFQTMSNGAARLSFMLSYADAMGFIGECLPAPEMSIPGIVRSIQSDERFISSVNDDPLSFEAFEYSAGDGVILKEQIFDKQRGIPLIVIMPKKDYIDPSQINLPVNPNNMLRSVAGNALVYYSRDLSFVEEMKFIMPESYKCTGGMIRYYLPNVDTSNASDANRHRFIHYDEALNLGEERILKIFRRVVSQDINDYDKLFSFRDCQELIRRDSLQARINQLKKKHEENNLLATEVQDDLVKQLEKMELDKLEFEILNDDLKSELDVSKKENYKLNAQLENIMASFELLRKGKEAYDTVRDISALPSDPKSILEYFAVVFSDRIAITENCWKSLKDCRTSPEILWTALYSIVTTLHDCLFSYDSFADACAHYNEQAPYVCVPGNTGTTNKDKSIMREYEDYYNESQINIAPHLKSNTGKETDSRFFRIHFCKYTDRKNGSKLIIIGSCGGHMTTAGTSRR